MPHQPENLDIDVRPLVDGVCVAVTGDLDFTTVGALRRRVDEELTRYPSLTLDLAGVEFCDSEGLAALVQIRKACDATGAALRLERLPEALVSLLRITGLTAFLTGDEQPAT